MTIYRVRINAERIVKSLDEVTAILAVLKDLEIDTKFKGSPEITVKQEPVDKGEVKICQKKVSQ